MRIALGKSVMVTSARRDISSAWLVAGGATGVSVAFFRQPRMNGSMWLPRVTTTFTPFLSMSAQFYVHLVPDRAAVAQHGMDVRDQAGRAELHRLRPACLA